MGVVFAAKKKLPEEEEELLLSQKKAATLAWTRKRMGLMSGPGNRPILTLHIHGKKGGLRVEEVRPKSARNLAKVGGLQRDERPKCREDGHKD